MDKRLPVAVLVSCAIVGVEVVGLSDKNSKPHAEYSVPAPTVAFTNSSNVAVHAGGSVEIGKFDLLEYAKTLPGPIYVTVKG